MIKYAETFADIIKITEPGWNSQIELIGIMLDTNYNGCVFKGREKSEIDLELDTNYIVRN